ncbi:MAG TPA: peptidase C25, partial [Mariniflexile sp.]|nr:peptidase C25 [Mariniflexile sp.]
MKEKLLLILCVVGSVVFAQERTFTIDWRPAQKISTDTYTIEIPSFNAENFSFNFDEGLLFVSQWALSNSINEASITVNNVNYASIPKSELKDLDVSTIPKKLTFSLKNAIARDKQYAVFQLSPIINDQGNFKKVTSFQISYNTSSVANKTSVLNKFAKAAAVSNSVLNTGEWYRFYVDTTGVFKLSKSFLQRLGVRVNEVDPRTIKLYGNGGRMIPYSNAVAYPFDVQENAIKFVGESDGVFNNDDYILFYAEGPKGFNNESNTNINCYTDKTYYYINVSSGFGKRIQPFVQPSGPINLAINTFEDYKFHETDLYNIASLGRRWFGERFDIDNNKTFNFDFPDLVT